ncbi:hypothetical protein QJS66_19445 [Kocuria rhizophila]|nr:hypothetical protein QJS66_19445 [Kocuria rhizophila]
MIERIDAQLDSLRPSTDRSPPRRDAPAAHSTPPGSPGRGRTIRDRSSLDADPQLLPVPAPAASCLVGPSASSPREPAERTGVPGNQHTAIIWPRWKPRPSCYTHHHPQTLRSLAELVPTDEPLHRTPVSAGGEDLDHALRVTGRGQPGADRRIGDLDVDHRATETRKFT